MYGGRKINTCVVLDSFSLLLPLGLSLSDLKFCYSYINFKKMKTLKKKKKVN